MSIAEFLLSFFSIISKTFSLVSKRGFLLMVLSLIYFCGILVGAFLMQSVFWWRLAWPSREYPAASVEVDPSILFVETFIPNLVFTAFVLVTLAGSVFFVLPFAVLLLRGVVWGMLIQQFSTLEFMAAFPTLILEGIGYALAGIAGVVLGLSWLNPSLAFKAEELGRKKALRKAWRECVRIYVLVIAFLFAAAIAEVLTMAYL